MGFREWMLASERGDHPTHFVLGPRRTACGIIGWQLRMMRVTRDPQLVTCKRCRQALGLREPPPTAP